MRKPATDRGVTFRGAYHAAARLAPERRARGHGAEVVTYDRHTGDREAVGAALAAERGASR